VLYSCAQLALSSLKNRPGPFVNPGTHDLCVANTGAGDDIVFHRGETTAPIQAIMSISTWIGGHNGGNFPMPDQAMGGSITVQVNGTV